MSDNPSGSQEPRRQLLSGLGLGLLGLGLLVVYLFPEVFLQPLVLPVVDQPVGRILIAVVLLLPGGLWTFAAAFRGGVAWWRRLVFGMVGGGLILLVVALVLDALRPQTSGY